MTRVAAIDCGTNTIRLLIAEAHRDDSGRPHLEVLRRRNEIVRLGQGVDRTGLLDPEALERTLAAVASYAADCAELAAAYAAAHDDYLARRAELGQVPEIEGVSAGGMPTRVKCLHALLGHSLAAGAGVNPIGDRTLEALRERGLWDPERCSC